MKGLAQDFGGFALTIYLQACLSGNGNGQKTLG